VCEYVSVSVSVCVYTPGHILFFPILVLTWGMEHPQPGAELHTWALSQAGVLKWVLLMGGCRWV
jgi:hypothetical protein